jgi:hypothetical protein
MITDEELAELPDDREQAFVMFEKIVRDKLRKLERSEDMNNADGDRLEYINKVVAAAKAYQIEPLMNWGVPRVGINIYEEYVQFTHDVDHVTTQIRILHAPRKKQGTVGLDTNNRTKIHHHIQQKWVSITLRRPRRRRGRDR